MLSCFSQTTDDPAKESFSYQNWRTSQVRAGRLEDPLFDLHRNDKTRPERQPEAVVRSASSSSICSGPTAQAGSLRAARCPPLSRKRVGLAPHRQDIRGDAASNGATSAAKLRLAQQGSVGSDCLLLRTGQEGLESFVASGCTMPVYIYWQRRRSAVLHFNCSSLHRFWGSLRLS